MKKNYVYNESQAKEISLSTFRKKKPLCDNTLGWGVKDLRLVDVIYPVIQCFCTPKRVRVIEFK
jgi:hypothetical protein